MKRNQSTALVRLLSSSLRLSLAFGAVGVFVSGSFAASTSKDTYYVNDHLATTVATSDAAGEIAQIEGDAFGSQAGAVAKDSRFTCKPYDADMGAYVFPFRNYRSDEARWMSADPSGFPDGVNGCYYAPSVNSEIDILGLLTVSVTGTTTNATSSPLSMDIFISPERVGSNIEAKMVVQWDISGSSSGWIIQNVVATLNGVQTNNYYEAWQVTGGVVASGSFDIFDIKSDGNSSGTVHVGGSASFYTDSQVSGAPPSAWSVGTPGIPAGSLNATDLPPPWYASSGGGVSHFLNLTWTE